MCKIKKGQVWFANLKESYNSVTFGPHPVVILGSKSACLCSPVVTVVVLTSYKGEKKIPTHVLINNKCLKKLSIACPEQITTISKDALCSNPLGELSEAEMAEIQSAVINQLGFAA